MESFDQMNLKETILRGIYTFGFEKPSLIQQKAIGPLITGEDLIAQSQSGTGKTATFSIAVVGAGAGLVKKPSDDSFIGNGAGTSGNPILNPMLELNCFASMCKQTPRLIYDTHLMTNPNLIDLLKWEMHQSN
jgi:hypothetical protein